MELNRRSLITGLISLVAAPAIVRVTSIMPVRQMVPPDYAELTYITRKVFVPRLGHVHEIMFGNISTMEIGDAVTWDISRSG